MTSSPQSPESLSDPAAATASREAVDGRDLGGLRSGILAVAGELDAATGPVLLDRLRQASVGRRRVLIDLRGVQFIDVAGVRWLADGCAELRREAEVSLLASSALERLLGHLNQLGRPMSIPVGPSVVDVDAVVLTPPPVRLRPVESRVLHR